MLSALKKLISNKINIDNKYNKYSLIIGQKPSRGARSPKLWNAVFKSEDRNCRMLPLDVKEENVINLLNHLNNDNNFIGGAIAIPYKEVVAQWLGDNITIEAKQIGAVNCLYRNSYGLLSGTNTDGDGAIHSLKKLGSIRNKNFLVLGTGGTSLSVSSYLNKYVNKNENLLLAGRKTSRLKLFKKKFNCSTCLIKDLIENIKKYDFVINCTDVGSIN